MRYVEITDRAESEVVRVTARPAGLRKLVYDLEAVEACTLYNIDQCRDTSELRHILWSKDKTTDLC